MKKVFTAPSSDRIHTLQGVVYQPEGEIRGFFHVVHGMTDHIARYEPIMQAACDRGYLAFGYDHLGHGRTARDESELGYFAQKKGYELLCKDVQMFSDAVFAQYDKERKLPYYLMGHSMGSFITRLAAAEYVKPDKYIMMGSGKGNPAAIPALGILAFLKLFRGDHYRSPFVQKMAFGSYSEHFGGGRPQDPTPWLTRDETVRKKYYADPFCTFLFTVSAMADLVRLNRNSNRRKWYEKLPRELPILMLSGDEDPVGDYGQGVKEVWRKLKETGHDAQIILYPQARHEILNDETYEQVKQDIFAFLEA